jgi:hypothetical protein
MSPLSFESVNAPNYNTQHATVCLHNLYPCLSPLVLPLRIYNAHMHRKQFMYPFLSLSWTRPSNQTTLTTEPSSTRVSLHIIIIRSPSQ